MDKNQDRKMSQEIGSDTIEAVLDDIRDRALIRSDETLRDDKGHLVGWIADDGKFHPCGAPLSADQLRAILGILAAPAQGQLPALSKAGRDVESEVAKAFMESAPVGKAEVGQEDSSPRP